MLLVHSPGVFDFILAVFVSNIRFLPTASAWEEMQSPLSIHPSVSALIFDSDLDLLHVYGHERSSHGIEGQRLESQFEMRSVGPRSSVDDSFLVCM